MGIYGKNCNEECLTNRLISLAFTAIIHRRNDYRFFSDYSRARYVFGFFWRYLRQFFKEFDTKYRFVNVIYSGPSIDSNLYWCQINIFSLAEMWNIVQFGWNEPSPTGKYPIDVQLRLPYVILFYFFSISVTETELKVWPPVSLPWLKINIQNDMTGLCNKFIFRPCMEFEDKINFSRFSFVSIFLLQPYLIWKLA